jgi:predicted permease
MFVLWRRLVARIRYRRFDADLAEELRFHEEMKRRELEANGLAHVDARAAARRALGNVTLAREDARRVWIASWLESLLQDARYAFRTLAGQPAYSLAAGITLVLGFGLNTSLFTVVKGSVLDPWPARNPDELVRISASLDGRNIAPSIDEFRFYREHARSFSGLAAHSWAGNGARLRAPGKAEEYLRIVWVSANFFDLLGVGLQRGTGFIGEDDLPGPRRAPLIISHHAWTTYFAGDPDIVGKPAFVSGIPVTVIGVLEERFDGLGRPVELWMPLSTMSAVRPSTNVAWEPSLKSSMCCIGVVGRLASGIRLRSAREEVQVLHEQFAKQAGNKAGRVEALDTRPMSGRGYEAFLVIGLFFGAVLLILVLACANVGNLQLARGMSRRREIATRLSIGASRGRVVRQLFTEACVLAFAAGAAALALAAVTPRFIFAFIGEEIPPGMDGRFVPDLEVAVFTFAICFVACVGFALAPAFHATRVVIPLGALDRQATQRERFRLRSVLLAIQVAACTVLLVGAGLLTRAITHAMSLDPGFRIDGVTVVSARLPTDGYTSKQRMDFMVAVLREAEANEPAPVALAGYAPLDGSSLVMHMALPHERIADGRSVALRQVSRSFFDVLGIPFLAGRMFDSRAQFEAVVNEAFVQTYFGGRDPLGHVVNDVSEARVRATYTIVGVVKDARLNEVNSTEPIIFTPARLGLFLTTGGPAAAERIKAIASATNGAATVVARPLRDVMRDQLEDARTSAALAWAIGGLGLALAIVGVFGVFAYAVEERRREIGVRMALGAAGADIVRMLLATNGRAMLLGLAAGLVASVACGPILRSYLYGLHPLDPGAYGMVLALLGGAAALATIIPARRALRTDPAVTLRAE